MTPAEAFDKLPPCVRVGGYDFRLAIMTAAECHGRGVCGEFRPSEGVIALYTGVASIWRFVDVFWHEVCHAISYVYGIDDSDKEERRVMALGTALMTLFRDNPWLTGWIDETLRPAPVSWTIDGHAIGKREVHKPGSVTYANG